MHAIGFFSLGYTWDPNLSISLNVGNVIRAYLPYSLNSLTNKTHIADAKEMLAFIDNPPGVLVPTGTNTTDIYDSRVYFYVKEKRQEFDNEKGEFKKRLDFCVQKMEEQNTSLKLWKTAEEAPKSLLDLS